MWGLESHVTRKRVRWNDPSGRKRPHWTRPSSLHEKRRGRRKHHQTCVRRRAALSVALARPGASSDKTAHSKISQRTVFSSSKTNSFLDERKKPLAEEKTQTLRAQRDTLLAGRPSPNALSRPFSEGATRIPLPSSHAPKEHTYRVICERPPSLRHFPPPPKRAATGSVI